MNAELDEGRWRDLGCKRLAVKKSRGRARWSVKADRRAPSDWKIDASHCVYLGQGNYQLGDDAWRISLCRADPDEIWTEYGHLLCTSEGEAFEAVAWIAAVARQEYEDAKVAAGRPIAWPVGGSTHVE